MTLSFRYGKDVDRLASAVREWSLAEVRPLARDADREAHYPEEAARIVKTCPVDVSPLGFAEIDRDAAGDKEWVALLDGGSNLLGCVVMEAMTYGDGWAWQALPGAGLGEKVVQLLGTPEQVDRWVGGVHRGEYDMTAIAMTEEHCGSDLSAITTSAHRDGDTWVLNGRKRFISNGAEADYVIVLATIDPALGFGGIRAFVVERDTPGYHVVKVAEDKLGFRFMHQSTLAFDDVVLPLDHCLTGAGEDGRGTMASLQAMNATRPFCSAWALGTTQAARDYGADWLGEHRGEFTARRWSRIEDDLAQMQQAIDEARRLILRAAWLQDRGIPNAKESSMAKAYASPLAEWVCLRVIQLMGAEGCSERHLVEKWYRDAKLFDIVEGTGQIQRITISRQLLGGGAARA